MSLTLTLQQAPAVPLEVSGLTPDALAGRDAAHVETLQAHHGNETVRLADFFRVSGRCESEIHIEGELARIKHVGAGMQSGLIHIHGNVGAHLGAGMSGGRIQVDGDAGDWVAPEMSGGTIYIKGNAGHLVGSAYRGSGVGMTGGEIFVAGGVRNELGHGMRNGLIAVGGDSGDFTGVNMLAGTIIVLGSLGSRSGAGMKRGTILSMRDARILPTFGYSCTYRPVFARMYLRHAQRSGLPITDAQAEGSYARWCGDAVELNRGEILLFRS
jgi:formylmethanofuran dehydrogenase subunit C